MELLQLKYFTDAARTENFSYTAKKHMVPQSTISQSIKKLESELGVRLFERSGNRVLLNESGRIFQKGVECALRELHDAQLALSDNANELNGEIRLLIRTNRRFVTKCISEFKNKYPNVIFSLYHEYYSEDYNKFDILIDDQTMLPGNFDRKLLVSEKIMIALSRQHPLSNRKTIKLSELAAERFVSMPKTSSLYKVLELLCRNSGYEPKIAIQCDDPYYIRKYVGMNLGVAVIPQFSWNGMFEEEVAFLDIEDMAIKRDTYVHWNNSGYVPAAAKKFMSFLIEKFDEEIREFQIGFYASNSGLSSGHDA